MRFQSRHPIRRHLGGFPFASPALFYGKGGRGGGPDSRQAESLPPWHPSWASAALDLGAQEMPAMELDALKKGKGTR